MKNLFFAIVLITIFLPAIAQNKKSDNAFVTSPYLQIGSAPNASSLQLLWHATDDNSSWIVEHKTTAASLWTKSEKLVATKIAVAGIAPHIVYRTALTGLVPGSTFIFRVTSVLILIPDFQLIRILFFEIL